jgi:hypothetical protein
MDESDLMEWLEQTRDLVRESTEMDEANTKAKIVRPLLETLGWDITSDVELEYGFQMGSTTHYVDYALTLDGVPELFVEVKGCYNDLTERHLNQLYSYMKTQNIDWGLLTNGRSYYVCRRRIDEDKNAVVDVLGDFPIADFLDHRALVSALSRESIAEGRSEEIAANVYELRETYAALQAERGSVVESLADTLVARFGDHVEGHAEAAARTAVEEFSGALETDAMGVPDVDPAGTFWAEVEAETGIVKQGSVVVFPDDRSATDCFAAFVDLLFERGHLTDADVPIASGRKRYLVNDDPVDQAGESMYSPREVGDGYYLETNYSRNDIKQRILELAEYREG